jgi:hypothetical protein
MANVSFSKKEWDVFCREHGRFNRPTLWSQMNEVQGHQEVDRVLEIADQNFEGHGIESVQPEGAFVDHYYQNIVALYVNFGDTYAQTLLYDTTTNTFMLTSWGDFLESWEAIERRARDEGEDQENDVCVDCGLIFPREELHYNPNDNEALCTSCYDSALAIPTWEPDPNTLVCMLRSIEGAPVAVHLFDPIWDGSAFVPHSKEVENGDLVFSFSVPVDGHPEQFHARDNYGAGGHGQPYTWSLRNLIANMTKWPKGTPEVLRMENVGVRITPDQYALFRVALDAFLENGMRGQPIKEALVTPPLLFTCSEINYVLWLPGERDESGAVEAFVNAKLVPSWHQNYPSSVQDSGISLWSAQGQTLDELIEDGFIKWGDDNSVRRYLAEIGVCR